MWSYNVISIGDVTLALIPGEIFPELVIDGAPTGAYGTGTNPRTLEAIASDYGVMRLITVGLANDELGYIVPPSDYLLHPDTPYLDTYPDPSGEKHYEETNSIGINCAVNIAEAFERAMKALLH